MNIDDFGYCCFFIGSHRNNGSTVLAWDENHRINWEGANIKDVEQQLWKRKALEAVHILTLTIWTEA